MAIPNTIDKNSPQCLKGDGGVIGNNQSVVFLGNPASAVLKNMGAKNQKCEISSSQLIYLTVYPGKCSTGSKPNEGECPNKSPAELLNLAQGSNKGIKLMQVKVDGQHVSSNIVVKLLLNHSILIYLPIILLSIKLLLLVKTIHQWLKIIICSLNHCQLEIIG